jgi:primase-polymerase (primpol)-like protein
MCDDGILVVLQVDPASQDIVGDSDQEPAVGAEAGDELISHRRDNGGVNGQKWKTDGPTGIADGDPAVNQFLSEFRADLPGITALTQDRENPLAHTRSLARPRVTSVKTS